MLSKSSKWELGLVHYIVKFTISRFVIYRGLKWGSYFFYVDKILDFFDPPPPFVDALLMLTLLFQIN